MVARKSNLESAIEILKENGFLNESDKLRSLSIDLYSEHSEKVLSAAREIEGFCRIKAWGDLNIKTINGWEWLSVLEKISGTARKRVRKMEQLST